MDDFDEDVTDDETMEQERLLRGVLEVHKVSEKLDDEGVNETLAYVIKLIAKPDIPAAIAIPLITKLQALSFQFKMQGKYYMLVGKGEPDASIKKNLYLSMSEETAELVQALKYTTRTY